MKLRSMAHFKAKTTPEIVLLPEFQLHFLISLFESREFFQRYNYFLANSEDILGM